MYEPTPVIWKHLATGETRFWVVCIEPEGKTARAIVDPYEQVTQEYYVEEPEHQEALLLFHTSNRGARKHLEYLTRNGNYDPRQLVIKRVQVENLAAIIADINKAYRIVRQHTIRVDAVETTDAGIRRELLYSHWIPKH